MHHHTNITTDPQLDLLSRVGALYATQTENQIHSHRFALGIAEKLLQVLRHQEAQLAEIKAGLVTPPVPCASDSYFMTVRRYAAVHRLRFSIKQLKDLDHRAARFCQKLGIVTRRAHDELFGDSTAYHFLALDDVFGDFPVTGNLH